MRHNRYYLPKSGRKRRAQPARSVHGAAAWGVIPLYINEFIPGQVRALLPGFAYQVGIRVASTAVARGKGHKPCHLRRSDARRRRNHHRGGTIVIAAVQKPSAASRSAAIRFSSSLRYGCRTISRSAMRTGMIESCCRLRPLGLKLEDRCLVSDLGLAPCCSARFRGYSPHD